MRLREYLRSDLVLMGLVAEDAEGTIRAVVERLRERDAIPDSDALAAALLQREAEHTTALGNGVALPHATVPGLEEPIVAIAVAPAGAEFGPVGLDPVRVFFVLLSPPARTGIHIKLLARICRLVRHPGFIDALERAESAGELLEEVERVDAEHV